MKIGSLFAGIGGFDLAARWMGWETRWYSEIEPYACGVMERHFPEAPNLGDITKIKEPPRVDVLCGGFPCQDISLAGKGSGIEGERSGLWSHFARLIEESQPRWVVAENVSALRSRGLTRVLEDLHTLGYDAEWHCITAASVGAPHRRDRIWIIAWSSDGPQLGNPDGEPVSRLFPRGWLAGGPTAAPAGSLDSLVAGGRGRDLRHPLRSGLEGHPRNEGDPQWEAPARPTAPPSFSPGGDLSGWWRLEPNVGRVVDGVPSLVDRLRCLGNAVVPQIPYLIFQAIQRIES